MAMTTFDALMAEVNQKISEANAAASQANAAAAEAKEAVDGVREDMQTVQAAAQEAQNAAHEVLRTAQEWEDLSVEATTAAASGTAGVTLTQAAGAKKLSFILPRGADGAVGAKGDTGRSGVTFTLSGTKLYITTG